MEYKVHWLSTKQCDFCKKDLTEEKLLYDARTIYGPWATMCNECFRYRGIGHLGTGLGQKYQLQSDGQHLKVEG